MKKLLLFSLLFSLSVKATTFTVACTYDAITNVLITLVQNGDTIIVQPGDCILSNNVVLNRLISFDFGGSGTNQTILRSTSSDTSPIWFGSSSTGVVSVHDFTFVGGAANSGGFLKIGGGTSFPGPYHIYNIQLTNLLNHGISVGAGDAFGLTEFVYMRSNTGAQHMDFQGNGARSWTNSPIPFGKTNANYVEHCVFVNDLPVGNGFFDAYDGAQFVFRNNYCDGVNATGTHGYNSGAVSPRSWEIYNNTWTNTQAGYSTISIRGGSGYVYGNNVVSPSGTFCNLGIYRTCADDHFYVLNPSGFLNVGIVGKPYIIDFNHVNQPHGLGYPQQGYTNASGTSVHYDPFPTGQPTNGQFINIGFTIYYFVTALSDAQFGWNNKSGFGGGPVLIGATTAETITNLFNAVNLGPGNNITRTNWGSSSGFAIGHEFIATGLSTTRLILTNALDGNTDAYGWPANQQPGVITSYPLTGTNFVNPFVLHPCYSYSNLVNGVLANFNIGTDSCSDYTTNIIKLNRDYFQDTMDTNYTALIFPHPLSYLNGTNIPPVINTNGQFNINILKVGGMIKLQ